jgi:hypothetical protein
MRVILAASVLAATFAGSSAYAQSSTYVHHNFCLKAASGEECAYDTMAQCEAAKNGNSETCVQNSAPINHAPNQ